MRKEDEDEIRKRIGWAGFPTDWFDGISYFYHESKKDGNQKKSFVDMCKKHYCQEMEEYERMYCLCNTIHSLFLRND